MNESNDARTVLCGGTHLGEEIGVLSQRLVNDEFGCAQNPGVALSPPRAPLASRGEGYRQLDALDSPGLFGFSQVLPDRLGSGIGAVARGARESTKHHGLVSRNDLDAAHPDAAGGERARLVEAQAIHAREYLDGGQLLDEHTAACQRR